MYEPVQYGGYSSSEAICGYIFLSQVDGNLLFPGLVAQSEEHPPSKRNAAGSSPAEAIFSRISKLKVQKFKVEIIRSCSSIGRASASEAEGCAFEPRRDHFLQSNPIYRSRGAIGRRTALREPECGFDSRPGHSRKTQIGEGKCEPIRISAKGSLKRGCRRCI
jgi:hypothetical protein